MRQASSFWFLVKAYKISVCPLRDRVEEAEFFFFSRLLFKGWSQFVLQISWKGQIAVGIAS